MTVLREFLTTQKRNQTIIYPAAEEYFNALNTTPLGEVKVIILGQDPYHGADQAHGLSFSVRSDVTIPPSLKNIFKELQQDLGFERPFPHGNLMDWARQGVLLLNSVLTVTANQAASHKGKGWEQFTDRVIELVSQQRSSCVFLLWGAQAQKKSQLIDANNHLVLTAPHPSPLSAYRGFFGCQHFSRCNDYLLQTGQVVINWQID